LGAVAPAVAVSVEVVASVSVEVVASVSVEVVASVSVVSNTDERNDIASKR